jgi:hypothetical protein
MFKMLLTWVREDEAPLVIIRDECKQLKLELSASMLRASDLNEKVSRFHSMVWDGHFSACCKWLDASLDSSVAIDQKKRFQKLLYAASGQAHALVRVKGVPLIESVGVAYAETFGAVLASSFREMCMKMLAYSPKLKL